MENRLSYTLIIGITIAAIRAITMGTEKMLKVIIGNYIIGVAGYAFGEMINITIQQLLLTPQQKFIGISFETLANLLSNGQLTFTIIMCGVLVWLVYACSKIYVALPSDPSTEKLLYIALIPLTAISFFFMIHLSLSTNPGYSTALLQQTANTRDLLPLIINKLPVWIFLHAILTLLISSKVNINLNF
ncbi:MAG: hypothetical protein LBI53_07550 [Candidatus Peribacteria bacterium]|jgi:hypothetical protein|nr:hypothetical protein [Candidatus Peribacteria bacterium]